MITAPTIHRYLLAATLAGAVATVTPVWADSFTFSTGHADGRLASLSQPAAALKLETETADDFILTETTSIKGATITGLIPTGTPLSSIKNVEIEVYHVFPGDSVDPPSNRVPTRLNSPGDVEIDSATRDGSGGTLAFGASLLKAGFSNCHGKSISALAKQFGGISAAATALGFSSVAELQGGMKTFCREESCDEDSERCKTCQRDRRALHRIGYDPQRQTDGVVDSWWTTDGADEDQPDRWRAGQVAVWLDDRDGLRIRK